MKFWNQPQPWRILEILIICAILVWFAAFAWQLVGCGAQSESASQAMNKPIGSDQISKTVDGLVSVVGGDREGLSPLGIILLLLAQIWLSHRREVLRIKSKPANCAAINAK